MQEESNPTKEHLFDYLSKNDAKIQKLIFEQKFSEIIDETVTNCYDKIVTFGDIDEVMGVLATGLLHFLLTNALLTSQRKIEYHGEEIDIVIPDLKTLEKDYKKALIIYVPKTNDVNSINKKLEKLEKIQPEKHNIWLVLSDDLDLKYKYYVIGKQNNTFSKIIFDISRFVNEGGENKFKILRV